MNLEQLQSSNTALFCWLSGMVQFQLNVSIQRQLTGSPVDHLLFSLFPYIPTHSVQLNIGSDNHVINYTSNRCFGLVDTPEGAGKSDKPRVWSFPLVMGLLPVVSI